METNKRRGGLVVLAILNFVMGGLAAFGAIATAALFPLMRYLEDKVDTSLLEEEQLATIEALKELGWPLLIPMLAWGPLMAVLLIVSGIGYLKAKRFMGRVLGNIYAVTSVLFSIFFIIFMPPILSEGTDFSTIVGFIYPVITLILVNMTFKDNLTK